VSSVGRRKRQQHVAVIQRKLSEAICGISWIVMKVPVFIMVLKRIYLKEEFEERIQKNTILEVLNKVEVHQG